VTAANAMDNSSPDWNYPAVSYEPLARGLPKLPRGRPSKDTKRCYDADVGAFCQRLLQWKTEIDFEVSARGWCYILEGKGEITKGEFDCAQTLINQCRKNGLLPIDFCAEDGGRATDGIEQLDGDVETEIEAWGQALITTPDDYTPISLWENQSHYVEMAVEKIDLKSLFEPVCREFHVPITNLSGWSDLRRRTDILVRMYLHWNMYGNLPVLLYCGDHDPGGLNISGFLRDNLRDMAGAAALLLRRDHGLDVTKEEMEDFVDIILSIDRFGLNAEFIKDEGLTWIDNLETSSGDDLSDKNHKDHFKSYVQGYIARFGVRKCEANALVVAPEAGRQLCREAIGRYIDDDALDRYAESLQEPRGELRRAIYERFGVGGLPGEAQH
jgi:hypothetical protein